MEQAWTALVANAAVTDERDAERIGTIFRTIRSGSRAPYSQWTLRSLVIGIRDERLAAEWLRAMFGPSDGAEAFESRRDLVWTAVAIQNDATFLSVYPEIIAEFFLDAENPYGADSRFGKYGFKDKVGVKKAPAWIPIPAAALVRVIDRTSQIVRKFFDAGESFSFVPDTQKSREFFSRCFDLCDGEQTEIEKVRAAMIRLDEALVTGPKKALPAPPVPVARAEDAGTALAKPAFLEWNPDFAWASEWKIIKSLRDLDSSSTRPLTEQHARDIAESVGRAYADKIHGFFESANSMVERAMSRWESDPNRRESLEQLKSVYGRRSYHSGCFPVSYLTYGRFERGSGFGFSSAKRGGFDRSLLQNYLGELEKLVRERSRDVSVEETFHRSLLAELGLYFPEHLVRFAFLGKPWAVSAFERTGIGFRSLDCVRSAELRADPELIPILAERNAVRVAEAVSQGKAGSKEFVSVLKSAAEFEMMKGNDGWRISQSPAEMESVADARCSRWIAQEKLQSEWKFVNDGYRTNVGLTDMAELYAKAFWGRDAVADAVAAHAEACRTYEDFADFGKDPEQQRWSSSTGFRCLSWLSHSSADSEIAMRYAERLFSTFLRKSPDEATKFVAAYPRIPSGRHWEFVTRIPFRSVENKFLAGAAISRVHHWKYDECRLATQMRECFASCPEGEAAVIARSLGLITEATLTDSEKVFRESLEKYDLSEIVRKWESVSGGSRQ